METLIYILIGALSAAVGLTLEKIFSKKIKKPGMSFFLALVVTLIIGAIVALIIKLIVVGTSN